MAQMNYRTHPSALIENSNIADGCAIGPHSVLRNGIRLAENCSIGDCVVLDGPLDLGKQVIIDAHCFLRGPATIGEAVRFGPQACMSSSNGEPVIIKHSVLIGSNATISGPLVIAEYAIIEPGAVVTKNVPANAVVAGNPAKIVRYQRAVSAPVIWREPVSSEAVIPTAVRGVTLHQLPVVEDLRGNLTFGEIERHVPFAVKRYFLTFDVASEEARGEHAHRTLHQFLLCVHGRVHIVADDGRNGQEFILDRPNLALHLPPLVWGVQYHFSPGSVLLVLCSDFYDPEDYIRDYADFLSLANKSPTSSV
jgi:UDP-2-acetamido-3-amino-2,3-dideoxy-glucuronate N-acetyltransferase